MPVPSLRASVLVILALPFLAHAPALLGPWSFDPALVVSGLARHAWIWTSNGLTPGQPWIDAHAGVTNQALGGLAARDWLAGRFPGWNPYSGLGAPLAAELQNGALFLPFVLLLALPHGLLWLRVLLEILAGLAALGLFRTLRLHPTAALAAASLFALNGSFAWLASAPIFPIPFLPLLLLGIERARAARRDAPALIALGIGFSLLAGFPETALIDGLLGLAWAALRVAQAGRGRAGGSAALALRIAAGGAIGLLLGAPAILSFLAWLPTAFLGLHAGPTGLTLLPAQAAQFLFPTLYGLPLAGFFARGAQHELWFRDGGYAPLSLLALALSGLAAAFAPNPHLLPRPLAHRERALAALLAAWLALSLARAAGLPIVTPVFDLVPFLARSLFPLYVWPSWSLALATLAAFAIDAWATRGTPLLRRPALVLIPLAALALFAARAELAFCWRLVPGGRAWIAAGLAAAALTLALLIRLGRPGPLRPAALLGLLLGEATLLAAAPLLAGPVGRTLDRPAIAWLQRAAGLQRVASAGPLAPNYGAWIGVAQIEANLIPTPARWVEYARTHLDPEMNGLLLYAMALTKPRLDALRQAGVALLLTHPDDSGRLPDRGAGLTRVFHGDAFDAWRLDDPEPYFRATPGCRLQPASRTELVSECGPEGGRLRRLELADPGWHATIGGTPAPIATEDGTFQSVALPPGRATLRFAYTPPGLIPGAALAALGALLLLASPAIPMRSKWRHPADREDSGAAPRPG